MTRQGIHHDAECQEMGSHDEDKEKNKTQTEEPLPEESSVVSRRQVLE